MTEGKVRLSYVYSYIVFWCHKNTKVVKAFLFVVQVFFNYLLRKCDFKVRVLKSSPTQAHMHVSACLCKSLHVRVCNMFLRHARSILLQAAAAGGIECAQ